MGTVVAASSRNRRAGELLASGVPGRDVSAVIGPAAEAVDSVSLLSGLLADAGLSAPTVFGLAELVEGRLEPDQWAASLTAPGPRGAERRAFAA